MHTTDRPIDNLGLVSSKYKTIGGFEKEEVHLASPPGEKTPFEKF